MSIRDSCGVRDRVSAALATVAVAATAQALDVSLETGPGETIPVAEFGQLTLLFTVIEVMIARTIGRRSVQPRVAFIGTTMVLTALSLVPDVILSIDLATKATLVLTHLVAPAIVIPALFSCLPERGLGDVTDIWLRSVVVNTNPATTDRWSPEV